MTALKLTAGLLAAALTTSATSALAADLEYGRTPNERFSSAYEDPRYRELYGPESHSSRETHTYREQHTYRTDPHPPTPPGYVYRDSDAYRPYPIPRPVPRPYGYAEPGERHAGHCLPRGEIRRRLVDDGWREFQDLEVHPDVARVQARRPSGDLYQLKVDRCTGEVIKARLIARGGYGPYAEETGRRYFYRPYN